MPMLRVFHDHLMYFLHFQTFFNGEKTSSETRYHENTLKKTVIFIFSLVLTAISTTYCFLKIFPSLIVKKPVMFHITALSRGHVFPTQFMAWTA